MIRTAMAVVAAVLVLAAASSTQAGIKCRGEFQVVQGSEIVTPYCADNYLASVAREYGIRVTNAEVRNNPNKKQEVCRFVGHDIRVSGSCPDESPSSGRRGF